MLADVGAIAIGLVGLLVGGEGLIRSASRLARALGLPTLIIALTVVALGTSMPELVVSVSAALGGVSDVALGNVIGSNIANIGLILGLSGLIRALIIQTSLIRREIPIMIAISVLTWLMALYGEIGRLDGLALVGGYIVFTFALYRLSRRTLATASVTIEVEAISDGDQPLRPVRDLVFLLGSVVILAVGAQFTVSGAVNIARMVGISELVIGLTLVSVGTSLPEIVTAVLASWRGNSDIAAGNAIGSNIANILVILGLTALFTPIAVPAQVVSLELPLMIGASVIVLPLVLNRRLERWQAGVLLLAYLGYVIFIFASTTSATGPG